MALYVQKFGGTSVGSVDRIKAVAEKVKGFRDQGHQVVVVVSAMSGETNRLTDMANALNDDPAPREMDMLLSTGEQVTISLLAMALQQVGVAATSHTGAQVGIHTDNAYTKARIQRIETEDLKADLDAGKVVVVAGFQGVDEDGNITTLGRGGSDTTGVALAAALGADECQIYTDVDGVYTTDPRVCTKAQRLECITVEEMLELASLGSKVLQIRAVEFAGKYNVPLRVLSSFEDGPGTLIIADADQDEDSMEEPLISGIAFTKNEAKLTLLHTPDVPGVASRILGPIADANIEVDMIVQNVAPAGDYTDFTFTVAKGDYKTTKKLLEETVIPDLGGGELRGDDNIAKVSLVGVGMRSHAGVASKMFRVLADENVNIRMVSTSEIKISVVIDEKHMELAVNALHKAFGLDKSDIESE
ncbi:MULTISPECIES: aspartate kinase [Halomonas]|uniref:Aspartokinase n=1 Tax=Halomonas citrativorans TaxID=2742612 RepID=A0A1R4HYC2_9GAMM|nr:MULTISPECIES: aspartate kinase [Halomonas]MBE0402413.1 aspartate kinase [Halomonas citrativorans]SJN12476.1 Aspartokinase [Halomonas citrativorans]HCR98826.1 aspartate kinase [Halomonas sp.]